jgi:catechol 2,3-dioxygenase-like lactoylglutathione lyase family enzyme
MNTSPIGKITRIMLFVKDVPKVAAFYRDILGLSPIGDITPEWVELDAGSCTIALHHAAKPLSERGDPSAKIVFGVFDVPAGKARLEAQGVRMSKVSSFSGIDICDGWDPEGNLFQISSRGLKK